MADGSLFQTGIDVLQELGCIPNEFTKASVVKYWASTIGLDGTNRDLMHTLKGLPEGQPFNALIKDQSILEILEGVTRGSERWFQLIRPRYLIVHVLYHLHMKLLVYVAMLRRQKYPEQRVYRETAQYKFTNIKQLAQAVNDHWEEYVDQVLRLMNKTREEATGHPTPSTTPVTSTTEGSTVPPQKPPPTPSKPSPPDDIPAPEALPTPSTTPTY